MQLALNLLAIPDAPFALAFSGGGDSTALLHALRGRKPLILIVNHGLRKGSADEAQSAQAIAQSFGLEAKILTWSPPPISAGLQAKARTARYDLLGKACRESGMKHLITGHTEDDQAETVFMRLQAPSGRGDSGWRGAAAMRAVTPSPLWPQLADVMLCRPMLGVSRADVRAYLAAHQLAFIDDPSNENRDFARIRARDVLKTQTDTRRDMLELSEHVSRGRALEMQRLGAIFVQQVLGDDYGNLHIKGELPPRLIGHLVRAVSGTGAFPKPEALRRLKSVIKGSDFKGASLGGAIVAPQKSGLIIMRDPVISAGRTGVKPLAQAGFSGRTLWDGRFWVEGEGTLMPAGRAWVDAPEPLKNALKHCPAPARDSLPLWHNEGRLIGIGPISVEGERLRQVKSAVLPRLKREFVSL